MVSTSVIDMLSELRNFQGGESIKKHKADKYVARKSVLQKITKEKKIDKEKVAKGKRKETIVEENNKNVENVTTMKIKERCLKIDLNKNRHNK